MDRYDKEINIKDFLKKNPDIDSWMKENVKDYKKINNKGIVYWEKSNFDGCPEIIEGDFNCSHNNLTSLIGCPKIVEGDFSCSYNILTTLEGCPKIVEGDFWCFDNKLTSLEGCPETIEGDFYCSQNNLTSLEGCPEIVEGNFSCRYNPHLTEKDFEWLRKNCKIGGKIYS
jgi:hypothetical protein